MRLQAEAPRFIGVFLLVMGVALIAVGASWGEQPLLMRLLCGAGGIFVLFGVAGYLRWRRHVNDLR